MRDNMHTVHDGSVLLVIVFEDGDTISFRSIGLLEALPDYTWGLEISIRQSLEKRNSEESKTKYGKTSL